MPFDGQTALVTGANRGLGRHLARQLRDRGATVYAGARDPAAVDLDGVTPIAIGLTGPASVAGAAHSIGTAAIVINNAGTSTGTALLTGHLDDARLEMDTHFFGALPVTRAFAPQLGQHDHSAVLNVLSALSWHSFPAVGAYCAAKSAAWSMTSALRQELAGQGTRVAALHAAHMDTGMTRNLDVPKADPAGIARIALDGLAGDASEIIADDTTKQVLARLSGGVGALYPQFA